MNYRDIIVATWACARLQRIRATLIDDKLSHAACGQANQHKSKYNRQASTHTQKIRNRTYRGHHPTKTMNANTVALCFVSAQPVWWWHHAQAKREHITNNVVNKFLFTSSQNTSFRTMVAYRCIWGCFHMLLNAWLRCENEDAQRVPYHQYCVLETWRRSYLEC